MGSDCDRVMKLCCCRFTFGKDDIVTGVVGCNFKNAMLIKSSSGWVLIETVL